MWRSSLVLMEEFIYIIYFLRTMYIYTHTNACKNNSRNWIWSVVYLNRIEANFLVLVSAWCYSCIRYHHWRNLILWKIISYFSNSQNYGLMKVSSCLSKTYQYHFTNQPRGYLSFNSLYIYTECLIIHSFFNQWG